jgi:transcriptional regulator with XRE-family HTH domain
MSTRTKKLATLLTVAVVLSSGAYAHGSQAGDGGALADSGSSASSASTSASGSASGTAVSDRRGLRRGGGFRLGFGLDNLASRLGVSTTALQDALKAIRDSKTPEQRRTEFIQALAAALGKPADQVTSAVNSVLPDRGARKDEFAAALAKALGVDVAKVQAGLDKARQDLRGDRDRRSGRPFFGDTIVGDIAAATGADAAKVRSALQSLRPDRGDRRDDVRQKLATALGVTTDQLQAAIDKVETDKRNAFATALAQRLNIDVQKVQDVLKDLPRFGVRHG